MGVWGEREEGRGIEERGQRGLELEGNGGFDRWLGEEEWGGWIGWVLACVVSLGRGA